MLFYIRATRENSLRALPKMMINAKSVEHEGLCSHCLKVEKRSLINKASTIPITAFPLLEKKLKCCLQQVQWCLKNAGSIVVLSFIDCTSSIHLK